MRVAISEITINVKDNDVAFAFEDAAEVGKRDDDYDVVFGSYGQFRDPSCRESCAGR